MKKPSLLNRLLLGIALVLPRRKAYHQPETITIEITNRCDVDCVYCPRNTMTRKIGDMDLETFENIINQCKKQTNLVRFLGMGEPLLHPQLDKMIKCCNDNFIATRVFSNAKSLTEEKTIKIIEAGLDELIIQFDGAREQTYNELKKYGDFNKTKENIKRFVALKKEKGASKPSVVVKMIYLPHTQNEIKDYINYWRPIADYVEVQPFSGLGGLVEKVDKLADEKHRDELPERKRPCTSLWQQLVITWDANIVPCVMDFDSECIIGNFKEKTLKQIWNSPAMQQIRQHHIKRNFSQIRICTHCLHGARPLITTNKIAKAFLHYFSRPYAPYKSSDKFEEKIAKIQSDNN